MAKSPKESTIPPIKLGASKWRFGGPVGFVGTVLDETTDVTSGVVSDGWEVVGTVVGTTGLEELIVETSEPEIIAI